MSESEQDTLYELHSDRLHALLRNEQVVEDGLPTDDIVRALGLSEAEVNAILAVAESREIVEFDISSSPALWKSKSRLPQNISLPQPREDVSQPRPPWFSPLLAGLVLIVVALVGLNMETEAPEVSSPQGASTEVRDKAPAPPVSEALVPKALEERIEDRADASYAGAQLKRHRENLQALEARTLRWEKAAKDADCASQWSAGETCYLDGRHLARVAYDKEATELNLRATETRALIEKYLGK